MNRVSRVFHYALLAATATLVVVFYFQTRLLDLDRHNSVSQNLLHLKQLDTRLNEEMLKAVSLQLEHYDAIVGTVSRMKELTGQLRDRGANLHVPEVPAIDEGLNTFHALMLKKIDLVETVKSRAAVVRNTLNYLPLEVERIAGDGHDPEVVPLHRLVASLMSYNLQPSPRTRHVVTEALKTVEGASYPPELHGDVNRVLVHARANIKAIDDIGATMAQFIIQPTALTVDRIHEAHQDFLVQRIKLADTFRLILLVLSLALFAGLGVALRQLRKAHDAAERTSRQFSDALESISEGFAVFDGKERLTFWNSTFTTLHAGLKDKLVPQLSFADFHDACVEAGLYNEVEGADGEGGQLAKANGQQIMVRSRTRRWMLASNSRMTDGGIACVRIDVSETKNAQEELRKLSRAVEQSPATVIITDTRGVITYVNPKFSETTGYAPTEAIGQRTSMLGSGEMSGDAYKALWQTISSGREWRGEFHNKRKDGSLFWELASISPIKDDGGRITHYLAVKEDITERKRNMEAMAHATQEAQLANHAKTQFLANMSHELRTPLNAIIGFSEILKEQMFGPIGNENYLDYCQHIFSTGRHLLDVINEILDVSRIEAGTIEMNESLVDVADLCRESLEMLREQAEHKDQKLRSGINSDLPALWGDGMRIKQIVLNLLSNAVKFTPNQGEIVLSAFLDEHGGVTIKVQDTGPGIPEDQKETILEPFEQVSDIYTRSHEGSGLGLYLVNSFTKLHDGSLSIESHVDDIETGTIISVQFPKERLR
ncbi:MAG: PAS domain S-box protein [Alphaproteobacteria bacterium]|nr:PAS domain S-box protein [Alphaproteobacteria bacterium]MBF0251831.1 PAS domain S-box protein [Alphaproteobacteria bacterium]